MHGWTLEAIVTWGVNVMEVICKETVNETQWLLSKLLSSVKIKKTRHIFVISKFQIFVLSNSTFIFLEVVSVL